MIEIKNTAKGIIVKALSGFYYVDIGIEVLECKARGIFKKNKVSPVVGDRVEVQLSGLTPVIIEVFSRKNIFVRPPVANIEQFIIVSALKDPEPNFSVIDKFLVNAEIRNVPILICFNKTDLADDATIKHVKRIYGEIYPVIFTKAAFNEGIDTLLPYLKGKVSALVGPSGVGKSTVINVIRQEYAAITGEISEKNRCGRNTTRHVEIFSVDGGGMILDTPGFTSFDVPAVNESELQYMFPEFESYIGGCRFNGCRHLKEPDCAVIKAVSEGNISEERYNSYAAQIDELRKREKKKY